EKIKLTTCSQYHFLIEKNNTYYFLATQDRFFLMWLASLDMQLYAHNESLFVDNILKKIAASYTIDQNNIIQAEHIDSEPTNCLYISELSDSMLLFTPRWNYEGLLVDLPYRAEQDIIRNSKKYIIKRNAEKENEFITYIKSLHENFKNQTTY